MGGRELAVFALGTLGPSLLVAWLAGWALRPLAARWGWLDRPGRHKGHGRPTPLGGGLAIAAGVVAPLAAGQAALRLLAEGEAPRWLIAWTPDWALPHVPGLVEQSPALWALIAGAAAMLLVGLADDLRGGLDWRLRLALQLAIAAVCVSWQGWRLTAFLPWPPLTWLLSVLWIVSLVNAFNMLDNMDGAAAGVAAIAALLLAAALLGPDPETRQPQLFVAGFLLVVAGALLGFLWHNRPPARLFMGDAGSYFVGFCVAVAALLATFASYEGPRRHTVLAPLLVMAVPLYDLATVVAIRVREGRSPFEADQRHFAHRLVRLGLTRPQAVTALYAATLSTGLGALVLPHADGRGAVLVLLMAASVLALVALLERAGSRRDSGPSSEEKGSRG